MEEKETQRNEEEPRVRVMSDGERENFRGLTLEQAPDGRSYESPQEERIHIFEADDMKGLRNQILEHLLGRHWKWKVAAILGGLAFAAFLFFLALPALALLLVAGGIAFLLAQFFQL